MENTPDRRTFVRTATTAGAALALSASALPAPLSGESSPLPTRAPSATPQEAPFFDVVRTRRSVRKFTSAPVPEEHLRQILDAARLAPTSGNQQPWKFLVIRDRAILDEIRDTSIAAGLENRRARGATITPEVEASVTQYFTDYLSAPVYVVVLTDGESMYPTYNHWDGPLAAGYLMLAARALGYGTVFATDSISPAVTKQVLNIPDRYTRVCFTPVGVPEEWPETPEKKALDEFIVLDRF